MQNFVHKGLEILVVLIGISIISFALVYLSPGDPAEVMLTQCGVTPTEELLEKTRADLGVDRPFGEQYLTWLGKVVKGDMGESYSTKVPVVDKLKTSFVPTLKLALTSLVIMILVSVPLGILAAIYHDSWLDFLIRAGCFLGNSIPNFWIGLVFLSIFGVQLHWVPVAGGQANFRTMLLPAITLAIAMASKYTRQVRLAFLNEMNQDYVQGARVRGIEKKDILFRHILPNALVPLLTLLGLSLGSLLGGTAVVEIIYNYPGMGLMAVKAISAQDFPLIQGYVLWIALLYMVINLLVDLSYSYLDPRISKETDQ